MTDIFFVLVIIADFLAIQDILRKMKGGVEKFLWIVCVLALPLLGAGFWYYIQYSLPESKRIAREERERLRGKK